MAKLDKALDYESRDCRCKSCRPYQFYRSTMIPILQSDTNHITGDCFSACLASILEADLRKIPKFLEPGINREHFWRNIYIWSQTTLGKPLIGWKHYQNCIGYTILSYKTQQDPYTNRMVGHCIVAKDGEPIHCPIYGTPPDVWWLNPKRVYLTLKVPEISQNHFLKLR